MIQMKQQSKDVYVADLPIVHVGEHEIEFLKERVAGTERQRIRLCAHRDVEDSLHEMFMAFTPDSYIRASLHLKDESIHVVHGIGEYVFFDDAGNITKTVDLGDYRSGRQFFCRVPAHAYHTLLVRSDVMVLHEATSGPFVRADTEFAPWAPEDGDTAGIAAFLGDLQRRIALFRGAAV